VNAWVGAWASGGSMWADTRSTGGALCRCWRRRVVGHSGVNFVGVSNGMVLVLTFLILPERIHRCFLEKGQFSRIKRSGICSEFDDSLAPVLALVVIGRNNLRKAGDLRASQI